MKMYCPFCQSELTTADGELVCESGNAYFPEMAKELIEEGLKQAVKGKEGNYSGSYYSCPSCKTTLGMGEPGVLSCEVCGFKTKAALHQLLTERMSHE